MLIKIFMKPGMGFWDTANIKCVRIEIWMEAKVNPGLGADEMASIGIVYFEAPSYVC